MIFLAKSTNPQLVNRREHSDRHIADESHFQFNKRASYAHRRPTSDLRMDGTNSFIAKSPVCVFGRRSSFEPKRRDVWDFPRSVIISKASTKFNSFSLTVGRLYA